MRSVRWAQKQRENFLLPRMNDDLVSATVYELLVGAACIRTGLKLHMVPESKSQPVPDFRVTNLGPICGAIECKRRLSLSVYELGEADAVSLLYSAARPWLRRRLGQCAVEARFVVPVRSVSPHQFEQQVRNAATNVGQTTEAGWGTLSIHPLPFLRIVPRTRLYSPTFLEEVFEWPPSPNEWDGLICEVEPPTQNAVEVYKNPLCLKWRSESKDATLKKTRGIQSLWTAAIKQIPAGELGFVYIAYMEGARADIADARTQDILSMMSRVWHRWSIRVPVTVINRLYPRAFAEGRPDLIESAIPAVQQGEEHFLEQLPTLVFTGESSSRNTVPLWR